MFRTIALGTCVSVQGKVVRELKDGRLTVQVGQKQFTGLSVVPLHHFKSPVEKLSQLMNT